MLIARNNRKIGDVPCDQLVKKVKHHPAKGHRKGRRQYEEIRLAPHRAVGLGHIHWAEGGGNWGKLVDVPGRHPSERDAEAIGRQVRVLDQVA